MVNFIVCDDNKVIRKNVTKIIDKVMANSSLDYRTYMFVDFNLDFMKIIREELPCKVYILDIETPSRSGIDVAREIRKYDYDSIIIFLTGHPEQGYTVLQNEFMFLSFINKFDNYEDNLFATINRSLEIIGRKNALRLVDKGIIYTIPFKDILYITKDSVERKSVIVTHYTQFKLSKSLNEISSKLPNSFKQTHRACYVNMDRVVLFDTRSNLITFDNNATISLLSKTYKKGVKEIVE